MLHFGLHALIVNECLALFDNVSVERRQSESDENIYVIKSKQSHTWVDCAIRLWNSV